MLCKAEAKIESLMSEPDLRARVSAILKRRVPRATLHRWRKELGFREEFTPAYAIILAAFGHCRRSRKSVADAKQMTNAFILENEL